MNDKTYLIPESMLTILINYLKSKPYYEVQDGIKGLLELKALGQDETNEQTALSSKEIFFQASKK